MKNYLNPTKILLSFAVASMVFSCNSSDEFSTQAETFDNSAITFEASVTTRATDTAFESGDEISVTAYNEDGSTFESNVSYIYGNSVFYSDSSIKYESEDHALSFRAIYPYVELDNSDKITFEVLYDQDTDSNYTLSDLMTSYASSTTSTTPKLTFDHLLTKVIINISSEDVVMTDVVTIIDVATEVEYNLSTLATITSDSKNTVTMSKYGTTSYRAIIVPQNIESGTKFGTISVDGTEFEIIFDNGKLFYAGCEYEFDLSIRDGSVSFISSSINDWDDGDDTSEGDATFALADVSSTSYPTSSKLWIITDTEATYDDMSGLRDALSNYGYSTEKIMLEFPNLTSLPEKGLYNMDGFESISLPNATSIGANAFYGCDYLTLVEAPLVESVDSYAFRRCSALTSVDLNGATSIGSYAFYDCTALATLSLPAASTIDTYAFRGCTSLDNISLPAVTNVGTYAFYGCTSLANISLPAVTNVAAYAFYGCTALTSLTLATESTLEIFGDGSADCFTDVDISKIDLVVGSSIDVCDNTLFAPVDNDGVVYYGSFASITGGNAVEDVAPTSILEYSATNYPIYSNDWVINDTEAPLAYFVGLNEALTLAGANNRKINLSFPNLERFPTTAFYIDKAESITSIASVSAPNATEVGEYAFYASSSITSISMDKLETIGNYAFYKCDELIGELSLPEAINIGSEAFSRCGNLETISLPKATSIGEYAFYYCSSLKTASIPKATEINGAAFRSCTELVTVDISEVKTIANATISYYRFGAFSECTKLTTISLPEATSIGSYAFSDCDALTTISLPKATEIGAGVFYNCDALPSISLPNVTEIGSYAFYNCDALPSISLPEVTTIGEYAFNSCSSLTTVSAPETITIESYAFKYCTSLTSIYLPKVITIYNGSYSDSGVFDNCTALTTISLPEAITIGSYAFNYCSSLKTVSMPKATDIGSTAFSNCSSLTTVSLPETTSIGYGAFYSCSSLTTISLPKVTTLGSSSTGVFNNCTRLQSVSLPSLSVIYDGTFSSCYMLIELEVASNDGVALTRFGTYGSDLLDGIDLSYMTLTTGSTNASMVSGQYLTAPGYSSGIGTTSSPYVYTDQTYGPFKEIVIK